MNITINFKNAKLCNECPMLELSGSGYNYYSKCKHPKAYKVERISLTNWEVWLKYKITGSNHLDLIGRYETPRPPKCKKDNGI